MKLLRPFQEGTLLKRTLYTTGAMVLAFLLLNGLVFLIVLFSVGKATEPSKPNEPTLVPTDKVPGGSKPPAKTEAPTPPNGLKPI